MPSFLPRWALSPVLIAVCFCCAGPDAPAQEPIRGRSRIRVQQACSPGSFSETSHFIEHEGRMLRVHGLESLQGRTVDYEGTESDGVALVRAVPVPRMMAEATSGAEEPEVTSGIRRVLVVPVNLSDVKLEFTLEQIRSAMDESRRFIEENSRSRLTLTFGFAPVLTLPKTKAHYQEPVGTQDRVLYEHAMTALAEHEAATGASGEFDQRTYHTVVVLFPAMTYGYGGMAEAPGKKLWLNGTIAPDVFAHELGHNLGLGHADFAKPTAPPAYLTETQSIPYGNPHDIMGSARSLCAHFGAGHKAKFNWLSPEEILTPAVTGVHRLYAHDHPTARPGCRLIQLPRKGGEYPFFVELRGRDTVLVTRTDIYYYKTYLIDTEPGSPPTKITADTEVRDAPLMPGTLFKSEADEVGAVVIAQSNDPADPWVDVLVTVGPPPDEEAPRVTSVTVTNTAAPSSNLLQATTAGAGGRPVFIRWQVAGFPQVTSATPVTELKVPIGATYTITATPTDGYSRGEPITQSVEIGDPLLTWTRLAGVSGGTDISVTPARMFWGSYTSTTGGSWEEMRTEDGSRRDLTQVAYFGGRYVGIAWGVTGCDVFTSHNGTRWRKHGAFPSDRSPVWMQEIASHLLVADQAGSLFRAGEDLAFTRVELAFSCTGGPPVSFAGKHYLLTHLRKVLSDTVTSFESSHVVASDDGQVWRTVCSGDSSVKALFRKDEHLVARGGQWAAFIDAGETISWRAVRAYDGQVDSRLLSLHGRVVYGAFGNLFASADALTWTSVKSGFPDLYAVSMQYWKGRVYVASTEGLFRSADIPGPPAIMELPGVLKYPIGASGTLRVTPQSSGGDWVYEWRKNGELIPGATGTLLQLGPIGPASGGRFTVTIRNTMGSATFIVADVSVVDSAPSRLVNLSIRGKAGIAEQTLIAGFVLHDGSEAALLARVVGPGLRPMGVTNSISHARLSLRDQPGRVLRQNSGWAGDDDLRGLMSRLGAFALVPESRDAVIYERLGAAAYTIGATPEDGRDGEALIELYEDDLGTGTARLVNISSRGSISQNAPLIAGFYIAGDLPMRVVIRGIGPSLRAFDVTNAATDTVLRVYDASGKLLMENDDWDGSEGSGVAQAFAAVGAFEVPYGSKDAAVLIELAPGAYTTHLYSKNKEAAIGLLEVYRRE